LSNIADIQVVTSHYRLEVDSQYKSSLAKPLLLKFESLVKGSHYLRVREKSGIDVRDYKISIEGQEVRNQGLWEMN
jgi:hypothetical protein